MSRKHFGWLRIAGAVVLGGALAAACSASSGDGSLFEETGSDDGSAGAAPGTSSATGTTSTGDGFGGFDPGQTGTATQSGPTCESGPTDDKDMDGFTVNDGDCNDCDPNVNPGAMEVKIDQPVGDAGLPEPADEDCDGEIDNVEPTCDDGLLLEDSDPIHGAAAVDICHVAKDAKDWGLIEAKFVRANGNPAPPSQQFGILDNFGPNVNVQLGTRMLGLSSGRARLPNQPGACGSLTCTGYGAGTPPPGFPQDSPACMGGENVNDDVGLEVKLRAPKNATGYSFLFDFYSFEYPEWVCTTFNDQFIALVTPPPAGAISGNISFDTQSNPVSVNIAFFQVCAGCALGTNELAGTGFDAWDDAGATSWLKTTAPIVGGEEVSVRFTIWDTGDSAWDSTVLVDGFQWIANGGTVVIGTKPIDTPK